MARKTSNALEKLDSTFGRDPGYADDVAEERMRVQAARTIYDARKAAGLTQQQLAEMVGTKQSSTARLDDADYGGHTITMLNRIAAALGKRLEVRFDV